jgi:hypothetical protein
MTGMEGVLVRKKSDCRVVISLDAIMQCVAVEVDANDLEPVQISRVLTPPHIGQINRSTQPCRAI